MTSLNYKTMSLEDFISEYDSSREKDVPEMKKMFLSMDKKMKMYHESDYIITSFKVQDIIIYQMINDNNETVYDVNFSKFAKSYQASYSIKDNIFYMACLVVGIYNNCLSYIDPDNPHFLKNNFNLFAENMPNDVVPYYRGVIERCATVYLSEFVETKEKQEIDKMKAEAESEAEEHKKNELHNKPLASIQNDTWGTSQSAFSSIALFPLIIAVLGVIIPIIISVMS